MVLQQINLIILFGSYRFIATLTLPTSGFAWSIFISDSQSQRLSITPTSSITQYRHNGTQSNGSAVRKHCSQPWDSHNQSLAHEHSTINQLTSPCTHTQRRVVLWLTFTSRDHACTHTVLWLAYSQSSTQRPIRLHRLLNSLASVVPNVSSNGPVLILRQTSADHQAKDGMQWLI